MISRRDAAGSRARRRRSAALAAIMVAAASISAAGPAGAALRWEVADERFWSSGDPTIADFDRDGRTDMLIHHGYSAKIRYGSGRQVDLDLLTSSADSFRPTDVAALDADANGRPDVLVAGVASGGPQLRTLAQRPDGTFSPPASTPFPVSRLAAGTDEATGESWLFGVGEETWVQYPYGAPGRLETKVATLADVGSGDVNGDGRVDAVVLAKGASAGTDALRVTYRAADGYGWMPTVAYGTNVDAKSLTLGDFNRDDKADTVVQATDVITVAYSFTSTVVKIALPAGATEFNAVATGDITGDGWTDLVYAVDGVLWARVNRAGTLQPAMLVGNVGWPLTVAIADRDGDGANDLLVLLNRATLRTLRNVSTGEATSSTPSVSLAATPVGGRSAAVQVRVTNTGHAPLVLRGLRLGGSGADQFTLISTDCDDEPVPTYGTCEAWVRFSPTVAGTSTATLRTVPSPRGARIAMLTGTTSTAATQASGSRMALAARGATGAARITTTCEGRECAVSAPESDQRAMYAWSLRQGRTPLARVLGRPVDGAASFRMAAPPRMPRGTYSLVLEKRHAGRWAVQATRWLVVR